jgi:enoyl-[acyl-carrier-protein] reductase (NADH)
MKDTAASKAPLGRALHTEDIAGLVSYLASDIASAVTGQTFTIDCGVSALM